MLLEGSFRPFRMGSPPGLARPVGSLRRTSVQDLRKRTRQDRGMRFDTKIAIAVRAA
jgi:hypothetical protein